MTSATESAKPCPIPTLGATLNLADLNRQARKWLDETARVRVHRTTHEQPVARLAQEQPALIRLPHLRFEGSAPSSGSDARTRNTNPA